MLFRSQKCKERQVERLVRNFDEEAADDIVVDDDAADMPSDPRWDALKGLVENDNN